MLYVYASAMFSVSIIDNSMEGALGGCVNVVLSVIHPASHLQCREIHVIWHLAIRPMLQLLLLPLLQLTLLPAQATADTLPWLAALHARSTVNCNLLAWIR